MSRYVLGRIVVSEGESDSHHQTHDYKGFNPSTDWDTVDWLKSNAIQVQSVSWNLAVYARCYTTFRVNKDRKDWNCKKK